jgi:hypothetical protein
VFRKMNGTSEFFAEANNGSPVWLQHRGMLDIGRMKKYGSARGESGAEVYRRESACKEEHTASAGGRRKRSADVCGGI